MAKKKSPTPKWKLLKKDGLFFDHLHKSADKDGCVDEKDIIAGLPSRGPVIVRALKAGSGSYSNEFEAFVKGGK